MINPLRYVTKKLQHQSLNESSNKEAKVTSEDRDSGTESDDEHTFDETEIASEMSSEVSSGCSVRSRPTSQTSTDTLTCEDLPMGEDSHDMPPPTSSSSQAHYHHHRRITRQSQHHYLLRAPSNSSSSNNSAPRKSPGDTSFGVGDYDAADPVEHHSSEEELETLTGSWGRESGPASEKRKWSQVARLSLTDSGSSDDEVCVLTTGTRPPVEFRTSPPLEVHKPLRSVSPPSKMLTLSASSLRQPQISLVSGGGDRNLSTKEEPTVCQGAEGGGAIAAAPSLMNGGRGDSGARAASPRKRHRHTPRPYRPCLDFEKMQQMKNRAVTQWRNGGELSLSFF